MNRLMELLPSFYENSEGVNEIQKGFYAGVQALENAQSDLHNQLFIDTATWSLDLWDKFLGVYTKGFDVSDRRKVLKSKLLSQPNFTKDKVINILKSLVDDADVIEDNPNYTFDMYLKTKSKFDEKVNTVIKEIESIKPAHLDYRVIIGYITDIFISEDYKKWESNAMPLCGTINVSYAVDIVCDGKLIGDRIVDSHFKYSSEKLLLAAEERYIEFTEGKSNMETVQSSSMNYQTEIITSCSETNYCEGGDNK